MPIPEAGVTPDPADDAVLDPPADDDIPPVDPPADDDPDKGAKAALVKEREERRREREERRKLRDEVSALREQLAAKDKPAEEQAIEQARREAREEAQKAYNQRLVTAELKAALAGKVRNTTLALKVIDSSEIEVDANGDIDPQSVTDAIDALLSEYPELVPVDDSKFRGGADQGAKGKQAQPSQVTRTELSRMTPEQIMQAQKEGRLAHLIGGK